tara:strand:- start:1779 stop:2966 length:1188 start_codon:yes stop_codon:yes gene_type:complete
MAHKYGHWDEFKVIHGKKVPVDPDSGVAISPAAFKKLQQGQTKKIRDLAWQDVRKAGGLLKRSVTESLPAKIVRNQDRQTKDFLQSWTSGDLKKARTSSEVDPTVFGGRPGRVNQLQAERLMNRDQLEVSIAQAQNQVWNRKNNPNINWDKQELNNLISTLQTKTKVTPTKDKKEKNIVQKLASAVNSKLNPKEIAEDANVIKQETTAPKLPETGWSNVFTKDKDGNMVGVMTRNQRLAWEKANFQQQQSLIEPGKLGQLGTNVNQIQVNKTPAQEDLTENILPKNKITPKPGGSRAKIKGIPDPLEQKQTKALEEAAKKAAEEKAAEEALKASQTEAAASAGASVPWLMIAKAVTALATDTSQRAAGFRGNQKGSLSKQGSSGLFDDVDPYSWA